MTRMLLGLTPLLLFAAGVRADVVEPDRTIFQYKHSHWSVADGAPPGIYALAQGRDGFLWVGSLNGLYRFDGIAFEQISGADGQAGGVSALLSATDGTVWIGYNSGEIATYARGNLRRDRSAPKTDAYVMNLVQTQDGAIWAALGRPDHALLRRSNGRWEEIGPDWGLPQEWLIDTFVARDGSLWVTTTQSILVLRKGARRFERAGTPAGHSAISEDPAGIIWLSDDRGTQILFAPRSGARTGRAFPTPRATRNFRTRFDRQGNLWGVNGDGLFRLRSQAANQSMRGRAAAQVEHFTQNDGLTSSRTVSVLEDREGSVWIGTSLGLDQFRLTNVVPEPSLKSFPMWGIVLLGASDGSVYIGTADGIYRAAPGATPQPLVRHFPDPQAICEGPKGTIWVFGRNQLLRIRGGRVMRLNPPPADDTGFEGCAVDRRNVLWVNVGRDGLLSFASAKWKQSPVGARGDRALLLTPDRQGRVLILLRSGALIRLTDDGQPRPVLLRRDISDASMIAAVGRGLLIGGPFGLGRVDGGQLRLADSRRFSWLARPTGIVETAKGQLWLITARGIAGISATDLEQGFGDARAGLRPTLLSFDDGLPNIQSGAPSSAAQGGDGRVWFSTLGGAVWIDPAHFIRNVLSPPVVIRALAAQGINYSDPTNLNLPRGTSSVAIVYAGLSLAMPSRVRFRYRLSGIDREWVDAGTRREASYSNLRPGTYRFQVIAANNDGVWNREGATLAFTIPPTFLQSLWFKALLVLALLVIAWCAYAIRLRQVTATLQGRFDIRVAERERIARELHDTLLQGVQGLLLRFQAVANRIPPDDGLRGAIDEALDRADDVLVEGRKRVRDLRSEAAETDLAQALLQVAADLVDGDAPRVRLTMEGSPRPLHPIVREEAQRIAEEAVRNACRHAKAQSIDLLLTYGPRHLRLAVRDDGAGMPESVLANGRQAGHFGLVGMRERATRVGGRLDVTSRAPGGTEVTLMLPARVAYADGRRRFLDQLRLISRGAPER